MTGHVRKQIRGRVFDALTQIDLFDGRVYKSRYFPLEDESLPGLLLYTLDEDSEREDSPTDRMRDLTVAVQGIVALNDRTLDDLIYSGIQSTNIAYVTDETKVPHAAIAMEFLYTYRTRDGAPDVAI